MESDRLPHTTPDQQEPATPEHATRDPVEQRPSRQRPRIYVASLAAHNHGRPHGRWIYATQEPDAIRQQIHTMLTTSPVPRAGGETNGKWFIHNYQDFGVATPSEHDVEDVSKLARGIAAHGEAYSAWADLNKDDSGVWGAFEQAYLGEYASLQDFGEHVVGDMGWQAEIDKSLPESVARYVRIDEEALANDMWLSGEIHLIHQPGGGFWIFRDTT